MSAFTPRLRLHLCIWPLFYILVCIHSIEIKFPYQKMYILRCTIQWLIVSSQGCTSFTTNSRIFLSRKAIAHPLAVPPHHSSHAPAVTNLLAVSVDFPVPNLLETESCNGCGLCDWLFPPSRMPLRLTHVMKSIRTSSPFCGWITLHFLSLCSPVFWVSTRSLFWVMLLWTSFCVWM